MPIDMTTRNFGNVPEHGDHFRLEIEKGQAVTLYFVEQVERGYNPPVQVASVTLPIWRKANFNDRIAKVLARGMSKEERGIVRSIGVNGGTVLLSQLTGRELAVILFALAEDDQGIYAEPIFIGWCELAREERWWLYSKGKARGQRGGAGWRKALFHALSECHP